MKNIFLILIASTLVYGCSNVQQHNSESVPVSPPPKDSLQQIALPDSALAFIAQHFPTIALQHVKEKKSPTTEGTFYEARLTDDTEIDFDKEGSWVEVKVAEPHQLPTSFFPHAIRTYLENNFADIGVESIDRNSTEYELELINDVKLYFDRNGKFLRQEI